jgi:DNA-binding transcriptional ArsR family regulator
MVYMNDLDRLKIFFQILGDSNRLMIIKNIGEKECSVTEIVEAAQLSQPLVSHHLKAMRENGILETKRSGPFIYYKLKDLRLLQALGLFSEIVNFVSGDIIEDPVFCFPPSWKKLWKC